MATKTKKLISGLRDLADYKAGYSRGVEIKKVEMPEIDVSQLRKRLGLSQQQFADMYGLSVKSVRNWEQSQRAPENTAKILLTLIDRNPVLVRDMLRKDHDQEVNLER